DAWKIGIERPTADAAGSRVVQTILRVTDVAVATSGDYRNFRERDGVRYSHTIDPRTGRPITHALASVTVIQRGRETESAALADAWATALNVLGPDQGPALAEQLGLAAYFLVRTEHGFEARATPAFAAYGEI
ncbi:MAG TPA: FAD:protein FMN transferase, partial [Enhygromyxa sp.]|nr:FAD:protein FMN transferase [Enhygromyxa sp.]